MKAKVETWIANIDNGNIKSNTEIILNCVFENKNVNIYFMRIRLGISHQSLTSIMSTLQDYGIVKVTDKIEIKNNQYSVFSYVENLKERNYLAADREREKVLNWLKQGFIKYDKYFSPAVSEMVNSNYSRIKKEQGTGIQLTLF